MERTNNVVRPRRRGLVEWAYLVVVVVVLSVVVVGKLLAHHHSYRYDLSAQTASQNTLRLALQQLDSSGIPILNRSVTVTYNGAVGVFTNGILSDTAAHTQSLPTTRVLHLYLHNTHATAKITVTWTPTGGSSAVVQTLEPGGEILFWLASTSSTAGITALSLQSDTSSATFESFLGG